MTQPTLVYHFRTPPALRPTSPPHLTKVIQKVTGYNQYTSPNTMPYGLAGQQNVTLNNPVYGESKEVVDLHALNAWVHSTSSSLMNHADAINELRDIVAWVAANKPDAMAEYARWKMVSDRLDNPPDERAYPGGVAP